MRRLVKVSFPLGFYQLLKVRDLQIACECRGFLGCFVGVKLVLQSSPSSPNPFSQIGRRGAVQSPTLREASYALRERDLGRGR